MTPLLIIIIIIIKYKQAIASLETNETQNICSICFYKGQIFFLKQIGFHTFLTHFPPQLKPRMINHSVIRKCICQYVINQDTCKI